MGMALCLWMGMWPCGHDAAYLPDFEFPRKSTSATSLYNARQCDPWDGGTSGRCATSTGVTDQCLRKYSYVMNLKLKRYAFKHLPCWCLTVLHPSTTHHSILKTEKPEVSPLSPGFIESLWSSGPDPGSQKSKRNSEGNRWDRRRCNPDSEDANARLDCGRHQGCVWPQGGNVQ